MFAANKEYLESHEISSVLEKIINNTVALKPADPIGFMVRVPERHQLLFSRFQLDLLRMCS
jgi:hypothetical protein